MQSRFPDCATPERAQAPRQRNFLPGLQRFDRGGATLRGQAAFYSLVIARNG
jgi:hypothetical protein